MTAADYDRAAERHPTAFLLDVAAWQRALREARPEPDEGEAEP